jgi:hypothetical protein
VLVVLVHWVMVLTVMVILVVMVDLPIFPHQPRINYNVGVVRVVRPAGITATPPVEKLPTVEGLLVLDTRCPMIIILAHLLFILVVVLAVVGQAQLCLDQVGGYKGLQYLPVGVVELVGIE